MKVKVSEATGVQLDWMVAKCLTGGEIFQCGRIAHQVVLHSVGGTVAPYFMKDSGVIRTAFEPSELWAQGGPIIEREGIATMPMGDDGEWLAVTEPCVFDTTPDAREHSWEIGGLFAHRDATPLIAAMRCFVSSKLGEEVEVPDELT